MTRNPFQQGRNANPVFRVITGSIGTVYSGNNYMQAMAAFERAKKAYPGEGTLLNHNGKIKREYVGNAGERTERIEA